MSDIVERLRSQAKWWEDEICETQIDAAKEIERLRKQLNAAYAIIDNELGKEFRAAAAALKETGDE